jgi:hypothetical protein
VSLWPSLDPFTHVDVWVTDLIFEEEWKRAGEELRQILREDDRVALHFRRGLDQTGTIAVLLGKIGTDPQGAIRRVRVAKSGII